MPVCVLFISSSSGIVFNPSTGAISDHSQSAKDIDPYFKSQLYVEDPGHRKPVSFYRMGWVNPESKPTTEIKFPPLVGFEPTTSWSTVQRVTTELSPLSKPQITDMQTTYLNAQMFMASGGLCNITYLV